MIVINPDGVTLRSVGTAFSKMYSVPDRSKTASRGWTSRAYARGPVEPASNLLADESRQYSRWVDLRYSLLSA